MELKIKLGKEVIDAIALIPSLVRDEQYLSDLKEELRLKHQQRIIRSQKKPMFYIEVKSNYMPH